MRPSRPRHDHLGRRSHHRRRAEFDVAGNLRKKEAVLACGRARRGKIGEGNAPLRFT